MSDLICIANERGCRVYARPVAETDGGLALLSATPMTHTADVIDLHEVCREIEDAWLDDAAAGVLGDQTPRYVSVLGVTLIPSTLAELIEAAGMILRRELLAPHPVRLGVFRGCALVVDDGRAMFSLMGIPLGEETARPFEAVTPSGPRLQVVKGGAK